MADSKLQFTVEIDPRRIDYKMINSQISDKIEELTSEDIIDKFFTDEMIQEAVERVVKKCMGEWLINNGYAEEYTNTKAVTKYVEEYCKSYIKDLCDEAFSEDVEAFITEQVGEQLPVLLVDAMIQHLYKRVEDYTCKAVSNRREEIVETIQDELKEKINL